MRTFRLVAARPTGRRRLFAVVTALVMIVGALAGLSAHVVRGLAFPAYVTAFVSSPLAGADAPIPILWGAQDTGLRVVCFNVANSSPPLAGAPEWPRVVGAGFELPGTPAGFSLLSPTDGAWELIEGAALPVPGHGGVGLDFAIVARPRCFAGCRLGRRRCAAAGRGSA